MSYEQRSTLCLPILCFSSLSSSLSFSSLSLSSYSSSFISFSHFHLCVHSAESNFLTSQMRWHQNVYLFNDYKIYFRSKYIRYRKQKILRLCKRDKYFASICRAELLEESWVWLSSLYFFFFRSVFFFPLHFIVWRFVSRIDGDWHVCRHLPRIISESVIK